MENTAEKVGVRELLEAGVHFGHQAKRWNPKMKDYIFAQRAGVHIVDLDQTVELLDRARKFVRSVAESGRDVLFVGTKKQAQLTLAEQAMRSGQPYVAERYIGGMLTNFQTIKPRIEYFKSLVTAVEQTPEEDRSGRDWFALEREYQKLRRNFAGLTEMERLPGALFVIDPKREELMVKEANRLKIPVVSLTDTNCDPEVIDYVIPGNDDAIRAINLISKLMADAVLEGKGEDEVQAEERPVPPVIEEAQASEEAAELSASADAPVAVSANGSGDSAEGSAFEGVSEEVASVEEAVEEGDPVLEEPVPDIEDDSIEAAGGDAEATAAGAAEAEAEDAARAGQVRPETEDPETTVAEDEEEES